MKDMILHYDRGAADWLEALPMGNGRIIRVIVVIS